jgi:hypothetical protein
MAIGLTHRSVTEFAIRAPIAGLKVLDGVAVVRNAIEDVSVGNARSVIPVLLAAAAAENPASQLTLHRSDFHQIRHLARSLERLSNISGAEYGDDASRVAIKIRAALIADSVINAFFTVGGTGAAIVLTTKNKAANDSTLNISVQNDTCAGLTDDTASDNTTAGVAAVAQVETAVVVGTITTAGNATVTVTAAGLTGSPKAYVVALALNDDDAAVASKFRAALAADPVLTALYSVGGTGANVTLTRVTPAANDATLNIAYADTTSDGLTEDATSDNTTAGVAGTAQVETQTVVGSVTLDGNVKVVITAAGLTGSPRTIYVPVQGSGDSDVVITDTMYADAKASASPAEQVLRAALVDVADEYIPGFTGVRTTIGGEF